MVQGSGVEDGRLLNVRQVAELLGVCAATVYELTRRGELRHVRVLNAIRVSPSDLSAFLAAARDRADRTHPEHVPSEGAPHD